MAKAVEEKEGNRPGAGKDAASRAARKAWRDRLNDQRSRTLILGTVFTPTDIVGFALIISMVVLTV